MPSNTSAAKKTTVLVLPKPALYRTLFDSDTDARLRSLGKVDFNERDEEFSSVELAERIGNYDVVVTSWRSPKFTEPVLENAKKLKLAAHSAGSIKFMFEECALKRGFAITTVAAAMGPSVAETGVLLILMSLRGLHKLDARMKAKEDWLTIKATGSGRELVGNRVGVVGAGYVGRQFIHILKGGFNCDVVVFDPYLSEAQARALGVRKSPSLDELMSSCPIVSLQAPVTPETKGMIGKKQLGLLRDGAVFINTARSALVDTEALLAEFKSGRIVGGIDVFDQEPLPTDSPWRKLENVTVLPHTASATTDCKFRQGSMCVDEVERFAKGEPLKYAVTPQMYNMMA